MSRFGHRLAVHWNSRNLLVLRQIDYADGIIKAVTDEEGFFVVGQNRRCGGVAERDGGQRFAGCGVEEAKGTLGSSAGDE